MHRFGVKGIVPVVVVVPHSSSFFDDNQEIEPEFRDPDDEVEQLECMVYDQPCEIVNGLYNPVDMQS